MDWPARLCGHHIRLEPLEHRHGPGLVDAAGADPSLYRWSPVPQGESEVRAYIDNALAWKEAGTAVPLAVVRIGDEAVNKQESACPNKYENGHGCIPRAKP